MAPKTTARQRKADGKGSGKIVEHKKQDLMPSSSLDVKPKHLHGSLPLPEISLYIVLWISFAGYMMYSTITASNMYKEELYPGDFEKGWTIIGRDKDICDSEWEFWSSLKLVLLVAFSLHSLGSLAVTHFIPKVRVLYYPLFSFAFLATVLGIKPVLYMISHCIIMYMSAKTRSVAIVWATALAVLASMQFETIRNSQYQFLTSKSEHSDLILYVSLMSLMRELSFALELCWLSSESPNYTTDDDDNEPIPSYTFFDLLVYNFYLPVFTNGPVITYTNFYKQFYQSNRVLTRQDVITIIWDIFRTAWWFIFLEVYLHYVYSAALLREAPVFMRLSVWTISGIMYSQLHIFLTKYVVLYRFSGTFARIDGLDPPGVPRCVSTLYLFGDMWRYFDRGLYLWMKRYIYIPMGGSRRGFARQIFSSFLAFTFVWAWHGGQVETLWWFIPNWIGVAVEGISAMVTNLPAVQAREANLSESNRRRVRALFGTVTCSCLILSNLVFLQGAEPVGYFITRIFYDGFPVASFVTLFGVYLSVQTNMELNRYKQGHW